MQTNNNKFSIKSIVSRLEESKLFLSYHCSLHNCLLYVLVDGFCNYVILMGYFFLLLGLWLISISRLLNISQNLQFLENLSLFCDFFLL